MLSQNDSKGDQVAPNAVRDSISQQKISYSDGVLTLSNGCDQQLTTSYFLPNACASSSKNAQSLRFVKKGQIGLIFSPSGRAITCKSESTQETEMNLTYKRGIYLWSFHCSGNCLGLTVGIRSSDKKTQKALDFSIQSAVNMVFRLDLVESQFKGWVFKASHQIKKCVQVPREHSWTPFIRVKGVGVSIFINDMVSDPQSELSNYHIFAGQIQSKNIQNKELSTQFDDGAFQPEQNIQYHLSQVDSDTLLLQGSQEIKLLRRNPHQKLFSFQFSHQKPDGKIQTNFTVGEIELLKLAGFRLDNYNKNGQSYVSKTAEEWIEWGIKAFGYVDNYLKGQNCTKKELYYGVYQILLKKYQSFRHLLHCSIRPSAALQSMIYASWGTNFDCLPIFNPANIQIPREIFLNNLPPFKFKQSIKQVISTSHYFIVLLQESQRISIINRQHQLFQVAQISLKKGIKKQNQLNQYRKQLEQLQSANSSEPSIYKILKNCLKYADKVKPPQKILQKIQQKEEKKQKKSIIKPNEQFQEDKTLMKQLQGMGFSSKLSKKALKQCNNASLQMAINLMLTKYAQEQLEEKQNSKKWSCQICTLLNEGSANVCAVCEAPKPAQVEQPAEKMQQKMEKEEIQETNVLEEVQSQNLEQNLIKIFSWELNLAYSPLLLMGFFKNNLRLRLFGPNPKYYSIFYLKDKQFTDLTNMSLHDEAYQIDQRPVRHQYYLTASQQERKEAAYSWIGIEDQDIPLSQEDGDLFSSEFTIINQTVKCLEFQLTLRFKKEGVEKIKNLKGKVVISWIYEEKKRAFTVEQAENKGLPQNIEKKKNEQTRIQENSRQIPSNGYIQICLSGRKSGEKTNLQTEIKHCQILDKVNPSKQYLPVVAANIPSSVKICYGLYPLQFGSKPLVLQSLSNKTMLLDSIIIQKIGKSGTNQVHSGTIHMVSTIQKSVKPIKMYNFELEKGKKKFIIDFKEQVLCNYVFIKMNKPQIENDLSLIEQMTVSGLIGQQVDIQLSVPKIPLQWLCSQMEGRNKNDELKTDLLKVEVEPKNCEYDLPMLEQGEQVLKQMLLNHQFDLQVKIYNISAQNLTLQKSQFPGWDIIKKKTVWAGQSSFSPYSQSDFQSILNNFMANAQLELLDILNDDKNKEYRVFLSTGKYNITDFLETLRNKKLDEKHKNQLAEFGRKYGRFFQETHHSGLESLLSLCMNEQKYMGNPNFIQILFTFLKYLPSQEKVLIGNLSDKISQIKKQKPLLGEGKRRKKSQQIKLQTNFNSYLPENLIYNRILMKKGKFFRRFTVDMVSVCQISNIILTFQKSQKKAPMSVEVYICDNQDIWNKVFSVSYGEYVWEQLSICPFTDEMEKIVKNSNKIRFNSLTLPLKESIKSRYLRIDVKFKHFVGVGAQKEVQKVPQSEIIPEIYGKYVDQSSFIPYQFSEFREDHLVFVRAVNHLRKYTVNSENVYFYDSENIEKKTQTSSSQNSTTLPNLISYILDQLNFRNSSNVPDHLLSDLVQVLTSLEKGKIAQKIISFLKKITKNDLQKAKIIYSQDFNGESLFHSIFKDSCLKAQVILSMLDDSPTDQIFENAIYSAKGKDDKCKQIFKKILPFLVKTNKSDETLLLHDRHGWIEGTTDLLNTLIQEGKKKQYRLILETCQDVPTLCNFLIEFLSQEASDFEFFSLGMEELMKRKVKICDVKELLEKHILKIKSLSSTGNFIDDLEESSIVQEFNLFSKALNKFKIVDEQLINLYIGTFKIMPNKKLVFANFISTEAFKKQTFTSKLIQLSLNLLLAQFKERKDNERGTDSMSLIYEILIFVFRNEADLAQAIVLDWKIDEKVDENIVVCFCALLMMGLSMGGEGNILLSDSQTRVKLSIAFCLSILSMRFKGIKQQENKETTIKNAISWLFINSYHNKEKQKIQNDYSHFHKIQQAVWHILTIQAKHDITFVAKILSNHYDKQMQQIKKIKSAVYRNLYEKKVIDVCNHLLYELGYNSDSSYLLKQVLFPRIMGRIAHLSAGATMGQYSKEEGKSESHGCSNQDEQQLANLFKLVNDPQKQPKDWLVHKNGAKDSVYKFEYPKNGGQNFQIVLKRTNESVDLSKIIIGFQSNSTDQQINCVPAQITVEGGSKLDELKYIGKLNQIPDNHFINYSVRIFGLSLNKISSLKVANSLNRYPEINYLRISIKGPKDNYATNVLNLKQTTTKTIGSSINFLSIQGFISSQTFHPEIDSMVSFIKHASEAEQKSTLESLLQQNQPIRLFKDCLLNLSLLMKHNEKYEAVLNKFIMRACEVNSKIGNETIQKYLKLVNSELCSKIVTEIIMSSESCLSERIQKVHNFIHQNIDDEVSSSLEPYLQKTCQLYFSLEKKTMTKDIKLVFSQPDIIKLINNNKKSEIYAKYLCKILSLQAPFVCEGLNLDESLSELDVNKCEHPLNTEILEALVISNRNARSWYMKNNKLETLFQNIMTNIKTKIDTKRLQANLKSFEGLCMNSNIKSLINKNQYNLQIFQTLVSDQYNSMLVDLNNSNLRQAFVQFICRSVLGSENEKTIALMLKKSLTGKAVEGNQNFVGQVFLPILNSFSKTPVCIIPYDSKENRLVFDISSVSLPTRQDRAVLRNKGPKFRLPSNIIENKNKQQLLNLIGQKCGVTSGNFNLALNHLCDAVGLCQKIQNCVLNVSQSILMLFKLRPEVSGKGQILGLFYSHQGIRSLPLHWNKNCILFTCKQDQSINLIDTTTQTGKEMLQVHKDQVFSDDSDYSYVEDKTMDISYNGFPFAEINFSNDVSSSYFGLDVIKKTGKSDVYYLQSAEYWLFQPSSTEQRIQTVESSITEDILATTHFTFFNKDYEAKNVSKLLRYDNIYDLPTSLTMRQIKLGIQILKCKLKQSKSDNLKFRNQIMGEIQSEQSINDVKKKNEDYPIVDIFCEINELRDIVDFTTTNQKKVQYLPKKGILKHFEENDGVKSMLKVIKLSVQSWQNKQRKQKWSQYVLELQKFSEFPHFFGMYLKDSQTFDLLFKLLSGLPDTDKDKKWDQVESKASQKLLKIISDILSVDKTTQFRQYAMKHDFFLTILERLKILTGQFKREYIQDIPKEEQQISPSKMVHDDGTKEVKKKKGVGYGAEGNSNTKWMKGTTQAELNKQFEVIEIILNIVENFLDLRNWKIPKKLMDNIFQSAFLPYLEQALRAGTLLQITKHPTKFRIVFKIIRTLAKHPQLVEALIAIPKNYQPKQIESLQALMKSLENNANIFLSCLKQNKDSKKGEKDKISEQLANDIIKTSKEVEDAVDEYLEANQNDNAEDQMKNILQMPLDKKYRLLMKDLRFDYIDMKEGARIKHHYSGNFNQNYVPNQTKMIRLAQELADISTALPFEHTNAIYVRCDKDRVDFMQALIMGSNGTPYGHGAFLFDVYFDDNYPNGPPKVNLTTTGHGKVRFNPNLYACGKVCLSLLGTWRGSASQNWDAKVSTLLQVLLSIQAIIMSEEVYFNEPGFENEQGTPQGEKKNQAYSNIVRYCNLKFAMLENIRNPPKGFQTVIRRHFYLKQHEIMDECKKWQLYAEKRQANYVGLVNDHNNSWSAEFKKSKTQYKQMLDKVVKELQQEFQKLPVPSIHDIVSKSSQKKQKKKKEKTDMLKKLEEDVQEEIDVAYETKDIPLGKQIDINDEKVKDRWSRYIGAMGIDAVSKQSKADILVCGLGPMALEVVKNLVLSGCRKLTICDDKNVAEEDLSGGFFYNESDIGKNRVQSIIHKIRELNIYVKIDSISKKEISQELLKTYNLLFVTQLPLAEQFDLNKKCRKHNIKFISAECIGAFCRMINDYGECFEVLDKNGEQPVEVIIKDISCGEKAVVTLLDGVKSPFEDGEAVIIRNVEGMKSKEDENKSINQTIHKIKTINSKSFQIGNTTGYEPYIRNGTAKNIKTPLILKFRSMQAVYDGIKEGLPIDQNMSFYDFLKMDRNLLIHCCFVSLDLFITNNNKSPRPWNFQDAQQMLKLFSKIYPQEMKPPIEKYVHKFSYTCTGYLPPLVAYFGGFISQEIIKAITQKFKPLHSTFYIDAEEIIPESPQNVQKWEQFQQSVFQGKKIRQKGMEIVVGQDLLQVIKNSKLFMIGAGAIGCQLLKNFAMIGLGTGEKGKITLTDPDHIENSNLNRQFLFREKHISKPKSRTAAASILLMNPELKGHISALLERVSQDTKNIFSNNFFQSLTIVANALDNVAARRYVDQRCVENKVPLFESGTLGPKGHTQVIIPYKTESYGSQNDPVEDGQIPHCTLKMFPEETLHCVEWARDIFGKKFSLQPKAFIKIQDSKYKPQKDDIKSLNECLVMANKGPRNFEDCIHYAITKFYKYFRDDIIQLLYTYPIDAKTKDGEPFWKLPKRPPTPIMKFQSQNILHCTFLASMAVLVAKIYKIPFPKNFREEKERLKLGKEAQKIKISDYVPSDEKAKAILKQSEDKKDKNDEQVEENEKMMDQSAERDEIALYSQFKQASTEVSLVPEEFEKDDDKNGHIDFIYSMANLRANNYKLDTMDWITTKLKAGRIVPALATTTTCVAGLQTLQICKYLKNLKLEQMRNSFLNLAVPSLQMSEPGQVKKIKLTDKLQVNLWDRWQVKCNEDTTFDDVYKELKERYGLYPIGVLQGMSRIDTSKTEEGKKEFLGSKLLDRLDREQEYIDIVVLFCRSEGDDKMVENVPPVRLKFNK